jgi:CRISPR-associated endonuclease/helicase Cas3
VFYAHSTPSADKRDWQTLPDHSSAVATLAASMGEPLGIGRAARLAGLLHDAGKYSAAFQRRLTDPTERVDHSTAGAALVGDLTEAGDDRIVAELIAYAIAGHHAGLPDRLGESGLEQRVRHFQPAALDPSWRELAPEGTGLWPSLAPADADRFRSTLAVLGRMIFSCLVDADYRDTEAFYDRIEGRRHDRHWADLQSILPGLVEEFDAHMGRLAKTDTALNRLRGEILRHVRSRAADARGLFTLTVPTGGGKTLASLAFALDHARRHGHQRIIYAIPFGWGMM